MAGMVQGSLYRNTDGRIQVQDADTKEWRWATPVESSLFVSKKSEGAGYSEQQDQADWFTNLTNTLRGTPAQPGTAPQVPPWFTALAPWFANKYPQDATMDSTWRDPTVIQGRKNLQGYQAGRYFGDLSSGQEYAFQTDPDHAWADYMSKEANPDSYYNSWLGKQYATTKTAYDNASLKDYGLQFTDYIEQAAPGLASRYLNLPGFAKGQNAPTFSAGRRQ